MGKALIVIGVLIAGVGVIVSLGFPLGRLPGDLVSVEEIEFDKITHDYTGSILGVVMKTDHHGAVEVNWTANTSSLPEWDMPFTDHYKGGLRRSYRFKVLSRKCEWKEAS